MSDLDKLVPQAFEITLAGETVSVKPLKVGQMPAFLRAITPVMQQASRARGSMTWPPTRRFCWRRR